ncbi:60S ribosomal protein L14 [Blattella germanica]|nr:60S ribosomal protein L14 [Blattella germanica]
MPFKRFVETGRVAFVADGPYRGKLCAIVDVIDQTRALVDGPLSGVPRGAMRLNQLHLTKYKINFPFTGQAKQVKKSWRRAMTDFDRFKLRKARQVRNKVRTIAYYKLKKTAAKERSAKKGAGKGKKGGKPAGKPQKKEVPKKEAGKKK